MKRLLALLLAAMMVLSFTACSSSSDDTDEDEEDTASEEEEEEEASTADTEKSDGVMTYAEYIEADVDSEVVVETYIQAKQSWWEDDGVGQATFYTQDADGGYFLYNMPCTEDEYEELAVGTKIKVTGYKSEWSGEVEIIDATFEIEDGTYVADPVDVTEVLADEDTLSEYMNLYVSFTGMTVEECDNGEAFMYSYDGSGSQGDDLYFNVSYDGTTYTFTVESYLCDSSTDVYQAVEGLEVGETIDMEGFLYWYEGANPHITSVSFG